MILQAVMKRLEERRRARLFAEMGSTMKLPRSGRGQLSLEVHELADQERPPMIRIPEYLEKRRAGRRRAEQPGRRRGGPVPRQQPRQVAAPEAARTVRLRVLIAPDSYKGTLTSVEVARALATGWRRARPDDDIRLAPLADGGEGTLVAIEAAGGWRRLEAEVADPLGRPIRAAWLRRTTGDRRHRDGPGVGAVAAWPLLSAIRSARRRSGPGS